MRYLPIHVDTKNKTICVFGGGEAAEAKLRTLIKTEARIDVYASSVSSEIHKWIQEARINWVKREFRPTDLTEGVLIYAATDTDELNVEIASYARAKGLLVNAADQKEACDFITPALVDRSPVLVSIGTEGTSPGLARAIKSDLEKRLPSTLGQIALLTRELRAKVKLSMPSLSERQSFWAKIFKAKDLSEHLRIDPKSFEQTVEASLKDDMVEKSGQVLLVGAGPGDPDLLTLAAQQSLHSADVIIYDRLVSAKVLELGRREAEYIYVGKTPNGPSFAQEDINALIIEKAKQGHHVVRLKSGDPLIFGRADEEIAVLLEANIAFRVIPGITAAAGAAAEIGTSLTTRGKNSSVSLMTGHDTKGFAEQDWNSLAKDGARAVVYMGVGASRFIQGRLLLHGASADMAVTVVENATRPQQKVLSTTLSSLVQDMASANIKGPAVLMLGYKANLAAAKLADMKVAS